MIKLLLLIVISNGVVIKEVKEKSQTKKFHMDKLTTVTQMPGAVDVKLVSYQEDSFCHVQLTQVKTETHKVDLIMESDFKDYVYNEESPLNFGQFIGMVHVRDGFIAITSDAKIYYVKFNYNSLHDIFSFPEYGDPRKFAGLRWKVDLQAYAPTTEDKEEIPQILYLRTVNLVLVIYPNSAQFFSVYEMEANPKHLNLYTADSWMKRKERGITKEYFGYIYSSVGQDGIDVYKVSSYNVAFVLNIKLDKLFPDFSQLSDFTVFKNDHNKFHMFMLDVIIGLIELSIKIEDGEFKYKVRPEIPRKEGGIAVDTKNGRNVFVVYKELFRYSIIEYLYDKEIEEYEIVNEHISHQKVLGLKATDEFVLIQGLIHHQLIFAKGFDGISPNTEPTLYTMNGVRNFMFYDKDMTDYPFLKKFNISGYRYDDFFFGVTGTGAFLARFNFTSSSIQCYSTNGIYVKQIETQMLTPQSYLVVYNLTNITNSNDHSTEADIYNPLFPWTWNVTNTTNTTEHEEVVEEGEPIIYRRSFALTVSLTYPEPVLEDELVKTLILVFVLLIVCLLAYGCIEKVRQRHEDERFQNSAKNVELVQQTPFTKFNQKVMSEDYKLKQERKKEKMKSQIQQQQLM